MKIKTLFAAALTMALPLAFTSCDEDIWGEWSKPTPTVVTPSEPEAEEEETFNAVATPLTFEAADEAVTVTIENPFSKTIKCSLDGADKEEKGGTTDDIVIEIPAGKTLQLYSNNSAYSNGYLFTRIKFNKGCFVYGNIMSLIDEDDFASNTTLSGSDNFGGLFQDNANLLSHDTKDLVLPATTLTDQCYVNMFNGCTGLTTAPELPATGLTTRCYYKMFKDCTNLTTAPKLPATTLASSCYKQMFQGCTSLNAVTCLATTISASSCTENWLSGVPTTGTFTKAASMTSWGTDASGTNGWTVQDYTE